MHNDSETTATTTKLATVKETSRGIIFESLWEFQLNNQTININRDGMSAFLSLLRTSWLLWSCRGDRCGESSSLFRPQQLYANHFALALFWLYHCTEYFELCLIVIFDLRKRLWYESISGYSHGSIMVVSFFIRRFFPYSLYGPWLRVLRTLWWRVSRFSKFDTKIIICLSYPYVESRFVLSMKKEKETYKTQVCLSRNVINEAVLNLVISPKWEIGGKHDFKLAEGVSGAQLQQSLPRNGGLGACPQWRGSGGSPQRGLGAGPQCSPRLN